MDRPTGAALGFRQLAGLSPPSRPSPTRGEGKWEAAGLPAEAVFDGRFSRWGSLAIDAPSAPSKDIPAPARPPLGSRLKKAFKTAIGSTPAPPDRPEVDQLSLPRRIVFGAKWGVLLLGMSNIIAFPFNLWAYYQEAPVTGFELPLPAELYEKVMAHPWSLLFIETPLMATIEELLFRILLFGSLYGALRFAGWAFRGLGRLAARLPKNPVVKDNLRRFGEWLGGLSRQAFWITAGLAAAYFSYSHFALWGPSFGQFVVRLAMGFLMAALLVKTRSIVVPSVAHTVNNALAFLGIILTYPLALPFWGSMYEWALAIVPSLLLLRQINIWLHTPPRPKN